MFVLTHLLEQLITGVLTVVESSGQFLQLLDQLVGEVGLALDLIMESPVFVHNQLGQFLQILFLQQFQLGGGFEFLLQFVFTKFPDFESIVLEVNGLTTELGMEERLFGNEIGSAEEKVENGQTVEVLDVPKTTLVGILFNGGTLPFNQVELAKDVLDRSIDTFLRRIVWT